MLRLTTAWKDERSDIERQLAEDEQPAESDGNLDPDAVIEELHYLELDRAEVVPQHPFALTENTSTRL